MDLRVNVEPIDLESISKGLNQFVVRRPLIGVKPKDIIVVPESTWKYTQAAPNIPYENVEFPISRFVHVSIEAFSDPWKMLGLVFEQRVDPQIYPELRLDDSSSSWSDYDSEVGRYYVIPKDRCKAYLWSMSVYPGLPAPQYVILTLPDELLT